MNNNVVGKASRAAIQSSPDRAACPSPEAIAKLATRSGPEAVRLATLDHVIACRDCRRDLDLLLAANRAGKRDTRSPRWLVRAATAVLVLGIGTMGVRMLARATAGEVERGRGASVVLVAPGPSATLTSPVALVWRAVPAAREYHLELLRADGTPLWSRTTPDRAVAVPDSILRPGKYRWCVSARLLNGATARSVVASFTVR